MTPIQRAINMLKIADQFDIAGFEEISQVIADLEQQRDDLAEVLKDCIWAIEWHQSNNKGRPDDSARIRKAVDAYQRLKGGAA